MDRVVVILFILGLSGLSYLYGVVSIKLHLFPFELVQQAWLGAQALRDAYLDDPQVAGAVDFEEKGTAAVQQAVGQDGAQELILMTGAAGARMDHCPDLGCLAWLMRRDGSIRHAWPVDPQEPWSTTEQVSGFTNIENFHPTSLHLYGNGDLLASYHGHNTYPFGVGIAKFDWDANLLWKRELHNHHKFEVAAEGMIYAPAHRIFDSPLQLGDTRRKLVCDTTKIYEDMIDVIADDGEVLEEISVLQSMLDSGYAGLVELTTDRCDPIHLNDVRVLSAEDAPQYPGLAAGDLLISMRNISTLAVIDRPTRRIKWLITGVTVRQHSPRYIGSNEILVLDNQGGRADQGGSRLVKINLGSNRVETVYPAPDDTQLDFLTEVSGYYDLDASRQRALVSLTMQGRIVEINLQSTKVLWEYKNLNDVDAYLKMKGEEPAGQLATFGVSAAYYVASDYQPSRDLQGTAGANH